MRTIVGLMMVSGCWHEAKPVTSEAAPQESTSTARLDTPEPPARHFHRPVGHDCFSLVPAMEQIFNRYQAGFGAAMSEVIDAVTNSCVEDGWSFDLIDCFMAAGDGTTAVTDRRAEECAKMLSHLQMEGFQRRLMEAMTKNIPPPPPPPSAPSVPTIPDPADP